MAALDIPMAGPDRECVADEQLVALVRSGEGPAFQTLYERYFRRVYNYLDKRLRNRADTEEATQEVFFNLFSSIHSFRGDAPFAAWVFGITRRTLAGRFKKKHHPMVPLTESEGEGPDWIARDGAADPLAAYEYLERLSRLDAAMRCDLSEEQRDLVHMHHLESLSIQEIAAVLGKSEDAVKSNLYRARKVLLAR